MMSGFIDLFASMAIMLPAFLIALTFHEFCHALAATALGDSTAKRAGRLTLNPMAHIDPLGMLFLLLFRIGWAKPVPFNQHNFKYPKFYSILTALAGPCSNLLLAFVSFTCIKHFPTHLVSDAVALSFLQILEALAYINVMLGVFNLLPIPPLDGSHLIIAFLSEKYPAVVLWIHRYALFILLFVFIFPPTRMLLTSTILTCAQWLKGLVF
jgi:Zn-dependent protease